MEESAEGGEVLGPGRVVVADRAGSSARVKKTLNMLPAVWITCGTPAASSAASAAAVSVAAEASNRSYTPGVQARSVASPAAVATGFPDSVPAW